MTLKSLFIFLSKKNFFFLNYYVDLILLTRLVGSKLLLDRLTSMSRVEKAEYELVWTQLDSSQLEC